MHSIYAFLDLNKSMLTIINDDEEHTPGNVANTSNLENNLAIYPTSYEDTKKQLVANMHVHE
jgi:hypothetical protein